MGHVLLFASDVARRAGVTPAAVVRWAEAGKLAVAAKTPSGARLFDPVAVAAFLKRRNANPPRLGRHRAKAEATGEAA